MFSGQSRDVTLHDSVNRAIMSKRLTVVRKEKKKKEKKKKKHSQHPSYHGWNVKPMIT